MKQLDNYILEKLKINKDSEKKAEFDPGDRCLRLYFFNENQRYFFIDTMTVEEHDEAMCRITYRLDKIPNIRERLIDRIGNCDYYYTDDENVIFREERSTRNGMIFLTKDRAKKFLDDLSKEDNTYHYDLKKLVKTGWKTDDSKISKAYWIDSFHNISNKTIKEIKDLLDEKPE